MAAATLAGCVFNAEQARPGQVIEARAGSALVVGRIRFFEDGREYFPWQPSLVGYERHLWLLRLDDRSASWELRPDEDGSLAVWLRAGDYALVGSDRGPEAGGRDQGIVAFLRVPRGAEVVLAGELVFSIEYREGAQLGHRLGTASVLVPALQEATQSLERRHGAVTSTPVVSAWCVDRRVAVLTGQAFEAGYRALLDSGCPRVER